MTCRCDEYDKGIDRLSTWRSMTVAMIIHRLRDCSIVNAVPSGKEIPCNPGGASGNGNIAGFLLAKLGLSYNAGSR
jgi:hypothetical protein